jgi:hypothetical protein
MDITEYENQGYHIGASATIKTTGLRAILVSVPRKDSVDGKIRAWVAMEFDTHVQYLANLDELVLTQ